MLDAAHPERLGPEDSHRSIGHAGLRKTKMYGWARSLLQHEELGARLFSANGELKWPRHEYVLPLFYSEETANAFQDYQEALSSLASR